MVLGCGVSGAKNWISWSENSWFGMLIMQSLLQTLFVLDTLLYVGLELSPYQVFSQIAFELVACLLLYEVFVCTEKGIVILV